MVKLEEFSVYWKSKVHDKVIRVAKDMGLFHQVRKVLEPKPYSKSGLYRQRDFYFIQPLYSAISKVLVFETGPYDSKDCINLEKCYNIKHKFTYDLARILERYMALIGIIIISRSIDCTTGEQVKFVRRCHAELFTPKSLFLDKIFCKIDIFIHKIAW